MSYVCCAEVCSVEWERFEDAPVFVDGWPYCESHGREANPHYKRVEELEAVLRWYADRSNYDEQGAPVERRSRKGECPNCAHEVDVHWYDVSDFGDRARAVLGLEVRT